MYIKRILVAIAVLGVLVAAYFSYYVYSTMLVDNTAFEENEVYIYIPTNSNYQDVREIVFPYLKNMDTFDALANRKQYVSHIKPGRYVIRKGMSNNYIINSIRSNNLPIKLSFNNQETLQDLAGRIAIQIEADSTAILTSMLDSTFLKTNDFNKRTVLGMFIPNSYEFFWNTTADKFRDRMLMEYHKFWNDSRVEKAKSAGLTPIEAITLASIVQKETAKTEERPRVAGVYINRLKRNIPLQADPTVIYAIKDKSGDFDQTIKRVLYRDLEIDSPYNTYKYAGLPPGLIAMPDISSIEAVLNYEKHSYYYFVVDVNRFGYHKFAKTLAQHNRNRQEYVNWINRQGIKR